MPSMPPGLSRSVTTWMSQVSVSVGATLVATMIYGALPKVTVPQLEPAPLLTSGGKFAARALPPDAPQAFDGLDTMPLPRVAASAAVQPMAALTGSALTGSALTGAALTGSAQAASAALQATGWQAETTVAGSPTGASSRPEPVRRILVGGAPTRSASGESPVRTVKALHPPLRADAKHAPRVVVAEAATPDPTAQVSSSTPDALADQGFLHQMMSTARGAWSVTASAGDALLGHVVPQIP